jgi:hypothetical protein
MIKKIILTDSPEEYTRKSSEKLIIVKDPEQFIKAIETLR